QIGDPAQIGRALRVEAGDEREFRFDLPGLDPDHLAHGIYDQADRDLLGTDDDDALISGAFSGRQVQPRPQVYHRNDLAAQRKQARQKARQARQASQRLPTDDAFDVFDGDAVGLLAETYGHDLFAPAVLPVEGGCGGVFGLHGVV